MLASYAAHLPTPLAPASPAEGPAVVLLTGSTGNVGSHVLAALLAEPRVARVYALNRSAGRHADVFRARGLPGALLGGGKLVELRGDVTAERLGLDVGVFDEVRMRPPAPPTTMLMGRRHMKASVTHVVHNRARCSAAASSSSCGGDRKSTRLNSSHSGESRMPSSA